MLQGHGLIRGLALVGPRFEVGDPDNPHGFATLQLKHRVVAWTYLLPVEP